MSPATDPRAELVSLLPRLRRFAHGLTGDGHAADDLVQAARLKAIERWHQWQPGTSLASWVFRIIQTTWLDEHRGGRRESYSPSERAIKPPSARRGKSPRRLVSSQIGLRRLLDKRRQLSKKDQPADRPVLPSCDGPGAGASRARSA